MPKAWAYLLRCADNSYYAGCAIDLEKRLKQHQQGTFNGFTAKRRPVELVWSQEFANVGDAIRMEQRIKKWSRAKKEALIACDFERLHELARSLATREKNAQRTVDEDHSPNT